MTGERSRYGLFVSALGAILLAVSVFLPWYGVSLTSSGVALAQQAGDRVASEFGNAALQAQLPSFHGALASLTGAQVGSLTGHDAVKGVAILLLVLAGLGMLDAMLPLVRAVPHGETQPGLVPPGAGGAVVVLGLVAAACVVFRMVAPPAPGGPAFALSLREGVWLSLVGSLMMALGGLWPRTMPAIGLGEGGDVFASLSGWTPS